MNPWTALMQPVVSRPGMFPAAERKKVTLKQATAQPPKAAAALVLTDGLAELVPIVVVELR